MEHACVSLSERICGKYQTVCSRSRLTVACVSLVSGCTDAYWEDTGRRLSHFHLCHTDHIWDSGTLEV